MTESLLVTDSSPLIGLARIGRLELLLRLKFDVVVPDAVWHEVTALRRPGAAEVVAARWIRVLTPEPHAVAALRMLVGEGEAGAIALAQAHPQCLLLADDSRARRLAKQLGLHCTGTLGILRRARDAGLLAAVRPEVAALREHGLFLAPALTERFLRGIGE
ncbi:MAG: DUF3368 domain-containing protein [Planctomycetota bacterium]